MKKCAKCNKRIDTSVGFYNYPSGPMHTECGKEKNHKLEEIRKKRGLFAAVYSEAKIK